MPSRIRFLREVRPPGRSLSDALAWLERSGLDACDLDARDGLRKMLAGVARAAPHHPAVLAVTAGLARVDGEIPRAIRTYHQALTANPPERLRAAILEDLIALEGSRHELATSPTNTPLAIAMAEYPEHVGLKSIRAIVFAQGNERSRALDDLDDVVERAPELGDVARARVLQRAAIAAYFLGDYAQARLLGSEAADVAKRCGAHRIAARAFIQLYIQALGVACDSAAALTYITEAVLAATIAEDRDLRQLALVAQYVLEAESGNRLRASDLQQMFRRDTHTPGYHAAAIAFADALLASWNDNWAAARAALGAVVPRDEPGEAALHNALRALVELAFARVKEAVRYAGVAVQMSRPHSGDPVHVLRNRHLARVLAAAAFTFAGQTAKAARLLVGREFRSGAPESVKALAFATDAGRIDDLREAANEVYGYGLLLAALRRRLYHEDGELRLNSKEIEILVLRSQGVTVAEIARLHDVARDTIMKRQKAAVAKLEMPNILAAISEARRRGLIS